MSSMELEVKILNIDEEIDFLKRNINLHQRNGVD